MGSLRLLKTSGSDQLTRVDARLVVAVTVLSLMVLARDLGYFTFTPIYFEVLMTLISIFLSYKSLRSFYFFYITVGISVHGISLIPIIIALLLKNRKINAYQVLFPIIILLFEFIHILAIPVEMTRYVIYSMTIILFFFLLFDDSFDDTSIKNDMKFYIIGTVVASLIIYLHSIANYGFQGVVFDTYRMGASFDDYEAVGEMVTSMNPNQLGFYSITAFSLLLYVRDIFNNKILKTILMVLLVIVGILSGSRTWILVMAFVIGAYLVFGRVKNKVSFLVVAAFLFVVVLQFSSFTNAIYGRYEQRFEEENVSTAGGRTDVIKTYNRWLINHPQRIVYGAGTLTHSKVCQQNLSVHNSIQQIIVCYGVIGLIIFVICFVIYHRRYPKRNHIHFWFFIPFIICFIYSQSGQFLSPAVMMLPFVATALPLKLKNVA